MADDGPPVTTGAASTTAVDDPEDRPSARAEASSEPAEKSGAGTSAASDGTSPRVSLRTIARRVSRDAASKKQQVPRSPGPGGGGQRQKHEHQHWSAARLFVQWLKLVGVIAFLLVAGECGRRCAARCAASHLFEVVQSPYRIRTC